MVVTETSKELPLDLSYLGDVILFFGPSFEVRQAMSRAAKTYKSNNPEGIVVVSLNIGKPVLSYVVSGDELIDNSIMFIYGGLSENDIEDWDALNHTGVFFVGTPPRKVPVGTSGSVVVAGCSYEEAAGMTYNQRKLQASDWEVLKELETRFLGNSPLRARRENMRNLVDQEL